MAVAGAETLEAQLPAVKQAERPVVILRMRAQESVGSSFIAVVERYAQQLKSHGGKLMLAGVHPKIKGQLDRTGTTNEILGEENVFLATTTVGASTREALNAAQRWLQEPPVEEVKDPG
jgi:SulP family sulfate permease